MTDTTPAPDGQPPSDPNDVIREKAAEATALAEAVAKVDNLFPPGGFIDPSELDDVHRAYQNMGDAAKATYAEEIRAKVIAHKANPNQVPAPTDAELALAIFCWRMGASPLTPEEIEAKTKGKAPPGAKKPKAEKKTKGLDDILSKFSI